MTKVKNYNEIGAFGGVWRHYLSSTIEVPSYDELKIPVRFATHNGLWGMFSRMEEHHEEQYKNDEVWVNLEDSILECPEPSELDKPMYFITPDNCCGCIMRELPEDARLYLGRLCDSLSKN